MQRFNIVVKETLSRIVTVEAETKEDAEELVSEQYDNEEIVLDSSDLKSRLIYESNAESTGTLSVVQKEALNKPCPKCSKPLTYVGDLSNYDQDIVTCNNCNDYDLFYDGSTSDD